MNLLSLWERPFAFLKIFAADPEFYLFGWREKNKSTCDEDKMTLSISILPSGLLL